MYQQPPLVRFYTVKLRNLSSTTLPQLSGNKFIKSLQVYKHKNMQIYTNFDELCKGMAR